MIFGLQYDAANRLRARDRPQRLGAVARHSLRSDVVGNRTNVTGAASCSGDYFMDAAVPGPMDYQMNQYTTTPCDSRSYDDNGNLVSRSSALADDLPV